jgi:hypothetical protein
MSSVVLVTFHPAGGGFYLVLVHIEEAPHVKVRLLPRGIISCRFGRGSVSYWSWFYRA